MNKQVNINILSVTVESVFKGNRLDKFLSDSFVEHSRSRIKSLILEGYVLNGDLKIDSFGGEVNIEDSHLFSNI